MADWREQYLTALDARDAVEKANLDLYNYCTKLADEKAELVKNGASQIAPSEPSLGPPAPLAGYRIPRFTSPPPQDTATVVQLRQDLGKAQQERTDLQTKLDSALRELETVQVKAKADAKRLTQLTASVSQLTTKVRDREEELRGKAKLVENVQDENVTLNLQLNMAEERVEALQKENQDLVDRWMARMGDEAKRMNEEGKFG